MAGDVPGTETGERRGLSLKWSLALFALVGFSPAYDLYEAGTVSWAWLAFGVVSWATAAGPVAASRFGQRAGAWFRAIGVLGRSVVIFAFAGAVVTLLVWVDPPSVPSDSFALGGLLGIAVTALRRDLTAD